MPVSLPPCGAGRPGSPLMATVRSIRACRARRRFKCEEADAGGDLGPAGAVEIEADRHVRLRGSPRHGARTHASSPSIRATARRRPWPRVRNDHARAMPRHPASGCPRRRAVQPPSSKGRAEAPAGA
jgi:hypothetical protein